MTNTTTGTAGTVGAGTPASGGRWQSIHIFYASDPKPLLSECVAPLVNDLRDRGLLARYFFINYWLEGPHVRLRLKPVTEGAEAEVRRLAETAIEAFLARRPALYEVDSEFLAGFYDDMFRLEYSEEERIARYGKDGPMPLRPNNSYHYIPYEPEYGKYGGPDGVELAEWHFERSSDLVLELIERANLHLRPSTLGLATQLMMIMSTSFLGDREAIADFMERYHHYWHDWFKLGNGERDTAYDDNYAEVADDLRHRFEDIFTALTTGRRARLTSFSHAWAEHCAELHARITDHAERGRLVFPVRDGGAYWAPAGADARSATLTDPVLVRQILLAPYMHMTNNRLGANVVDESYLSYLLYRSLREDDLVPGGKGERR
ncbi:lantibiotic dehydratase C-terminal domain-containing protein [Actinomadura rudentiformis]|uniref:Lantibiotic biosynthesis protein n=1 Tax=Actinomadura rudentiformis TaxID=359158 RepID=A0A6H9YH82_9ACTN|nr:lantibiotic dehydratase C-terminal domain-containing protein [Actinomadura rudentiformis]KAB2339979.1 lantibiotic biosynthesis protein [Actinomadura rudentiformis]